MGVKLVETLSHWGLSEKTIAKAALGLCDTFHLEDRPVCQGAVNEFKVRILLLVACIFYAVEMVYSQAFQLRTAPTLTR